jgi:hypothetical protein
MGRMKELELDELDLELCEMYAWYERQADLELQKAPFADEWHEYTQLKKGETHGTHGQGIWRRA